MTEKPSKAESACAYIAKVGRARSDALARSIQVEQKQITAILSTAVEQGYLSVCKVTQPGKQDVNEYRISAAGQNMTWSEFKAISKSRDVGPFARLPTDPSSRAKKLAPPPVPATAPADQPQVSVTTAAASTERAVLPSTVEAEAKATPALEVVVAAPAREDSPVCTKSQTPKRDDTPQIEFGLWSSGRMSIVDGDQMLILEPEDTRRLRSFLGCFVEDEIPA